MHRFSTSIWLIAVTLCFSKSMGNPVDGEIFSGLNTVQYEMPPSCVGQTFCFEKGDNYPEEQVEKLLKTYPIQETYGIGFRTGFSFRNGNNENGNVDCPANTTFVDKPIYYIVDESGIVRPVIQSPNKFEQLYSTRWCLYPGIVRRDTPHFFVASQRLKRFQIECLTTYMNLDFMVLADEDFEPTLKMMHAMGGIPVCCKCQYHSKKFLQ
ncbi:unnamed protein product [Spodoptera littoralis]|uniref:Spaetzle domain-containing protein n=1 Tax=Spodoptera littoralis TaxID=7109 RepID=A0A9P0I0A6_SPOLI|nr:unnamed protein product [Spodoptera littoralis]CAH1637303.1 unnamed protein product [Spodoptera littoralis]